MSTSQRFPVSAAKNLELHQRMLVLGLREEDLVETYFKTARSGGKSGLIGVALYHAASGIRVHCQRERSQGINRFLVRRMLVEKLEVLWQHSPKSEAAGDVRPSLPPQDIFLPHPPQHWGL